MTHTDILRAIQADGVSLTLSATGAVKASGPSVAVNRWLGAIRAHKAEIAEALKTETPDANQWRIEYSDGRTLRVGCSPRASLAQVQAEYPDGWVSNVGGPC